MCVVPEAGGSVCPFWRGSTTSEMTITQRSAFVLLDVDRKRRFGKQQHSKNVFFLFSFSQRETENVSIDADCDPKHVCGA
jgi:hypothetical protein